MLDPDHPAMEHPVMFWRRIGETDLNVKEHADKHFLIKLILCGTNERFLELIHLPASVNPERATMAFRLTKRRRGEGFFIDEAYRFS
jgi:hypothetical protein